jgi:N-acetylglucosaminyldiphosphoundecaprenol N-acetyl-beta-D-mannosaminyltransferase
VFDEGMPVTERTLFGSSISRLTKRELVAEVTRAPSSGGVRLLVTMNLDHIVSLRRSAAFRLAYSRAWAVTIDGAPVFAYASARRIGAPERVTGADLIVDLAAALPVDRRLFFAVSSETTGSRLVDLFVARGLPREALAYVSPPFGFENDPRQSEALASAIRSHRATDLIFGLGAPKSEIWIDTHRDQLGDLYAYGFGAGLDFLAGVAARAPAPLRRLGLEWAWRLAGDPIRLWRRYMIDSWAAVPSVVEDLAGRAPHGKPRLDD